MPLIDWKQAARFIELLTGSPDTPVWFQTYDDREKWKRKKNLQADSLLLTKNYGTLAQYSDLLQKLNDSFAGITIQINEGGRKAREVVAVRSSFIDDDGVGALPPLLTAAPPTFQVKTSSNARNKHSHWALARGESLNEWVATQKHLIAYHNTDKGIHNLDRVMRLPGTWHHKDPDQAPFQVQLIEPPGGASTKRWTLAELREAYPLATLAQAKLTQELAGHEPETTPKQRRMIGKIREWLTKRSIPYINKSDIELNTLCPFDATHGARQPYLRVMESGAPYWECKHDGCVGNNWARFKDTVGGWYENHGFTRGDHTELAARVRKHLQETVSEDLVYDEGRIWAANDKGLWETISPSLSYQATMGFAGLPVGGGDAPRPLRINGGDLKGVYACLGAYLARPDFFLEAPTGLAFANGFLTVTPAGLASVPLRAEHRQRDAVTYDYNPDAPCPLFFKYLNECFAIDDDKQAKIDFLQEIIGCFLLGLGTRFAKAVIFIGSGANGKSVLTELLRLLSPPGTTTAIAPQDLGDERKRYALSRARMNLASEISDADILRPDGLKSVITGDAVQVKKLYADEYLAKIKCGHVFSANNLPGTIDHTDGFWRRLEIVTWNRTFAEHERDTTLTAKIAAAELSGIAAWAIKGAARALEQNGYKPPASSAIARAQWSEETNPVKRWLVECTENLANDENPRLGTRAFDAYQQFCIWAEQQGHRQMTNTSFGRRIRELKINTHRTSSCNYYAFRIKVMTLPTSYMR